MNYDEKRDYDRCDSGELARDEAEQREGVLTRNAGKGVRVTVVTRNIVNGIAEYEQGDLGRLETLGLFAVFISTDLASLLQGSYGREAQRFIDNGLITADGIVTDAGRDWANEN